MFARLLCFVSCVYLGILIIFLFNIQPFSARKINGLLFPISFEIGHPELDGKPLSSLPS